MRILLTTDTVGGVWTYTRELSEGLLEAGCEVCLISLGRNPNASQSAWTARTKCLHPRAFQYTATAVPLEWMGENATCYTGARDLLIDIVSSFKPDLLHLNQLCFGALPVAIPKLVVVHSDVVSWFQVCRGETPPHDAWFLHYVNIVIRGLRSADYVAAPSAWMLERASEIYGPFARSGVIPNGRTVGPELDTKRTTERKLQAVTAGRLWDEAKNLRMLEKVNSPIPLLVAGECSVESNSPISPQESLTCLGPLAEADLLDLMAASSLYIVPSIYEPFGLAPLEAALAGCALLAMDIPSLREVWGETALYFNGPDDLSQRLVELAGNPSEIQRLASAAESRARELYSRDRMTARYLDLYGNLVNQSHAGTSERHVA